MSHGPSRQLQILMLAVMAMACPAAAQIVFDDGFDGPDLASRWQWRAPVAGPMWSLSQRPGWLRIAVPERAGGYNHWVDADEAPTLLTALPDGDWDVETRLQIQASGDYHAGLVVGWPPSRMLTLGAFFAAFADTPEPQVWFEPTGHGGFASAPGPVDDLWLRLSRRGVRIEASLKRGAEAEWQPLSHFSALEAPTHAGLLVKTFGQAGQVTLDADYVRVTRVPTAPAPARVALDTTVRVDPDSPDASLDPMRLGQFIEHMARVVYGGMWAEMLANRKFTGATQPTGVLWGWEPVGAAEGAGYSRDNDIYYVAAQSQRLETTDAAEHGISQSGLEVRAGVAVQAPIVARAEGHRELTVSVRRGDRVFAERQLPVGDDWRTLEFAFRGLPAAGRLADVDTLAVTVHGPGKLWIG